MAIAAAALNSISWPGTWGCNFWRTHAVRTTVVHATRPFAKRIGFPFDVLNNVSPEDSIFLLSGVTVDPHARRFPVKMVNTSMLSDQHE